MAAWFCSVIKFITLFLGFSQKLCGDHDSSYSWAPSSGYSPPPPPASGFPAPPPALSQLPASADSPPSLPDNTLTLSNSLPTSNGTVPASSSNSDKPLAGSPTPVTPVGSDLAKTTALKKVEKATDVGPLLSFVQALRELNITTIDDYDQQTREMLKKSFELDNEEKYMNTTQLIRVCGHPVQEYTVKTPDGYYLKLFRIPGSGPPVLLMHGLVVSSDNLLTSGCDKALPYLLRADGEDYDVWFGNARGNKYCMRHETLDPDTDLQFWDFSWHEIGVVDLATIIDFILVFTDEDKLLFVGHSQGTTAIFVLLSERPDYNDKVYLVVALSPVAFMGNVVSPFVQVASQFADDAAFLQRAVGLGQFVVGSDVSAALTAVVCGTSPTAAAVCDPIISSVFGFTLAHKDLARLPVQIAHGVSSSSTKQVTHYMQVVRSNRFQRFDYGAERNRAVYGSEAPPEYPVERITAPVALFYSASDWLADVADVDRLRARLPRVVFAKQLPVQYSHVDFVWAKDADQYVFNDMLDLFKRALDQEFID